MQTNTQTVKRNKMLKLCLPFIVDCSLKESLLFAKHLEKESFGSNLTNPAERGNMSSPPLCPQGSLHGISRMCLETVMATAPYTPYLFAKCFLAHPVWPELKGTELRISFVSSSRAGFPFLSHLCPFLVWICLSTLWHYDHLACRPHLHHHISPARYCFFLPL